MALNNKESVEEQYKTSENLQTRISIHEKYSTNKQGFGNWIFEHYNIRPGYKVLELGCGTGSIWTYNSNHVSKDAKIILSDFSKGMLEEAKNNIGEKENFSYREIDIQDIPFEEKEFDVVIANMMLYHVPNIEKALSEVKRVLKDEGVFYSATFGENGVSEYVEDVLKYYKAKEISNNIFTLQNGNEKLEKYFSNIEKDIYEDSLEVTKIEDLSDYILSLNKISDFKNISKELLYTLLEKRMIDGKIIVPKEYGMFICRK